MSTSATDYDRTLRLFLYDVDCIRIVLSGLVAAVNALTERSSTDEDAAGRISAVCTLSGFMTDQLDELTEVVRDALAIEYPGRPVSDSPFEAGPAADEPLEEFRALVEEVFDRLQQKIDDLPEDIREVAALIEDSNSSDAIMNKLDEVEDTISSAFAAAVERLDL